MISISTLPAIYFNEVEPFAVDWLGNLFPLSDVDSRSIADVQPSDVKRFPRCHFFAGVGGWELALRLAGWPADRHVWTGSCPCQPYSAAGKGEGDKDPRNLWPEMFRLIRECRPVTVFGEQVASAIRHGWLDGISADLEGEGYAVGSIVLGAHSAGAPHIRQRIFWVADAGSDERSSRRTNRQNARRKTEPSRLRDACGLGLADSDGRSGARIPDGRPREAAGPGEACRMDDSVCDGRRASRDDDSGDERIVSDSAIAARSVGDADVSRESEIARVPGRAPAKRIGSPWNRFDVVHCRDGKARRIEPGSFPLADGVPNRVGRLRGYGNAIVPQVAAAFIRAFLEIEQMQHGNEGIERCQ